VQQRRRSADPNGRVVALGVLRAASGAGSVMTDFDVLATQAVGVLLVTRGLFSRNVGHA
jgi:hypothetical protein